MPLPVSPSSQQVQKASTHSSVARLWTRRLSLVLASHTRTAGQIVRAIAAVLLACWLALSCARGRREEPNLNKVPLEPPESRLALTVHNV